MKKIIQRRLNLRRETLRSLSLDEAQRAIGGIPTMQLGSATALQGAISMPARACCLGPEEIFIPSPVDTL